MGNKFKCDVCGKEFTSLKEAEKHEKNCLKKYNKQIWDEEYRTLPRSQRKNYVKEWFCKCNNCNKTWHYLDEVEKKMKSQTGTNVCVQLGSCCNPCVGLAASNANTQLSKQMKELKQCPDCKSSNVKSEAKYFRKQ